MYRYRMLSWWLRKNDLPFPQQAVKDKFRYRADRFAAENVNTAIIFGAHFRWDFRQVWSELHEMLRFIADELHDRGIQLYDHHSSVLNCYYNDDPNRFNATFSNHRQILMSPPESSPLPEDFQDDWKMIDVTTGKPAFLPVYGAQEFCFNLPDFITAYQQYLRKLLRETNIDGLMSDDAFYYPHFNACGCRFCRERFKREYNCELPPASDIKFWGNWSNAEFRNWIRMRYRSVEDFMRKVKEILPDNFPLLSCCSGSAGPGTNGSGLNYREFIHGGANVIMLEMCNNTPSLDGHLTNYLPQQLHHLALAAENHLPCIGLGYGFSADAARIIWAFNKFLGSDMWFSSLVHRLGLTDKVMAQMPDDPELVGGIFNIEARFAEWFEGKSCAPVAIWYSVATLRNYGGNSSDYYEDYKKLCNSLFLAGYDINILMELPKPNSQYQVLLIPSAACLSDEEIKHIECWRESGKTLIISGPFGFFDEQGNRRHPDFAAMHKRRISLPDLNRSGKFPTPESVLPVPPVECLSERQLEVIKPALYWFPKRYNSQLEAKCFELLEQQVSPIKNTGWYFRSFHDQKGRLLLHCLVAEYMQSLDETLEALRDPDSIKFKSLKIIKSIKPHNQSLLLNIPVPGDCRQIEVLYPLNETIEQLPVQDFIRITPSSDCPYLIVRFTQKKLYKHGKTKTINKKGD